MTGDLFAAYLFGGVVGLLLGVLLVVVLVNWLYERVDQATTLPAPQRTADVIDLQPARTRQEWVA